MTAPRRPGLLTRFSKAWAAVSAGAAVVVASGLLTDSAAVWVSTATASGTAALAVLLAPANKG